MDGFITITDKEVMKVFVNTGTGEITRQREYGQNHISGKINKIRWYTV